MNNFNHIRPNNSTSYPNRERIFEKSPYGPGQQNQNQKNEKKRSLHGYESQKEAQTYQRTHLTHSDRNGDEYSELSGRHWQKQEQELNQKDCIRTNETYQKTFPNHSDTRRKHEDTMQRGRRENSTSKQSNSRLISFNQQINQSAKNNNVQECKSILADISKAGLYPDAYSYTPIINIFVKRKDVKGAYAVFEEMIAK